MNNQQPTGQWVPGAQPQPLAPAGPSKKNWFLRHKILTGLGAVVILIALINGLSGGKKADSSAAAAPASSSASASSSDEAASSDAASTTPAKSSAAPEKKESAPGIGQAVRDGKFEFTVTKVQKGVPSVGSQYLGEKAQGQFVLVHITIKNIGDKPQTMFDDNQQITDTSGRSFDPDSQAEISMDNNDVWMQSINPGNAVSGILVYDMPKDAVPASIELHDSMFSGGVKVSLK